MPVAEPEKLEVTLTDPALDLESLCGSQLFASRHAFEFTPSWTVSRATAPLAQTGAAKASTTVHMKWPAFRRATENSLIMIFSSTALALLFTARKNGCLHA